MKDGCGREIEYLRISVTDKCNLRCRYCMPEEGIRHLLHQDILSFEEIQRIVSIMKGLGIKKVRITGGEPLVRRGVASLVRLLPCDVYMTTNGCLLSGLAAKLKEAGLRGVNISLDTLRRDVFETLTGRDELESVLGGIEAAKAAGLDTKLNCVPIMGVNDDEIEDLCTFAKDMGLDIRFIELMPIGCAKGSRGIPTDVLIERLEKSIGKAAADTAKGSGPAVYYRFGGSTTAIGFISPMSHMFCDSCNRIRLTADGFLKLCLQYSNGTDLRRLLRSGADDEEIEQVIEQTVMHKPPSHRFGSDPGSDRRRMVQIGG